jgi:hypothetical protein
MPGLYLGTSPAAVGATAKASNPEVNIRIIASCSDN